jgi:RNA 2',3'-cyclic 3'-phosphodiesterase
VLDAIERLPRPDEPGVRWVPRAQWHVTLRFLGTTDVAAAVAALGSLRAAPAQVRLGPRVSRLGRAVVCLPAAGLAELAAAVAEVTADVGEPPDPRPFAGHLTVARLRGRGSCGLAGAAFEASFAVEAVDLVRSSTGPEGPRYETELRVPLR